VEDNKDIRFMLTAILNRAGYDAASASGLAQALKGLCLRLYSIPIPPIWRPALN
jgi:DNA-binding response OmpR family regulator